MLPSSLWDSAAVEAVSGGVAGLTTTLALHPLDVVKTRLQGACAGGPRQPPSRRLRAEPPPPLSVAVQNTGGGAAASTALYRGTWHALRCVATKEVRLGPRRRLDSR